MGKSVWSLKQVKDIKVFASSSLIAPKSPAIILFKQLLPDIGKLGNNQKHLHETGLGDTMTLELRHTFLVTAERKTPYALLLLSMANAKILSN